MPTQTVLAAATALALGQGTPHPLPSTQATTTYHRVEVNGVGIFYREAGLRDAPTILLLHGYPSSSRQWDALLPLLADRYHLIAPDYPGFGQSDAPTPAQYTYTFDNLAATMEGLTAQLGLARYTLFMQDYGGPVGFRMALAHPDRVSALIVQNANAYVEGLGAKWQGIAQYWADPAAHPEQVDAFMSLEGAKQRHLGTSPNPERYNPDTWMDEYAILSRPGERDIQAVLLSDYQTNVASYPAWQAWMRTQPLPTLVLWGRYDPSFIVPGAEAYLRDTPKAELYILDAGHFALDEATDRIAWLTRDFLGRSIGTSTAPSSVPR
ncbi:alpha/beta fold hydrolase [Methylobacterium sp. J-077]|uniref:alpha/beta fold hydrolase n=1 Tax=Methylobacterium sp. J-077 TaxID=2836656 RepID=UPI001FB9C687|nr:alpha/beta hydrolase [Methylobacterium sp. J-077]MCJ2121132.1 alpha/beta hydrolase [Methylobacterium sp. J-077]